MMEGIELRGLFWPIPISYQIFKFLGLSVPNPKKMERNMKEL